MNLSPALQATTTFAKASFWKRLLACIIDNVIIGMSVGVGLTILGVPEVISDLLAFIAFYVYGTFMEYSRQSTWGKDLSKLKVVATTGERPTLLQCFYRNAGKIVSVLPLFYGFLRILAPHQRQTIHDEMAGCLVVER